MTLSVPANCANPGCRAPSIKAIHCSSRIVAIDAIDGPPVYSHFVTFRCTRCGHTWAAQGHSGQDNPWPAMGQGQDIATSATPNGHRGWWGPFSIGGTTMRSALLGLLLIPMAAPSAWAQAGKHFAIGPGLNVHRYRDGAFSAKNPGISILYRIAAKSETADGWNWGAKTSVNLGKIDTRADISGPSTGLGKLRTIPVLIGVDRAYRAGRWRLGASVVAGPSFNHFDVDPAARSAYLARLGSNLGTVTVGTSVALKPAMSMWCDLGKWVALHASLAYVVNRPKAKTTIDGVTTTSTWKTDHTSVDLGFVVGLF